MSASFDFHFGEPCICHLESQVSQSKASPILWLCYILNVHFTPASIPNLQLTQGLLTSCTRKIADWAESSTKLIWNLKEKTTTVFSEDDWHSKHHSQRVHFLFTVFEILFRQYWTRGLVRARRVFGVARGVCERWSVVYFVLPECWSELFCVTVDIWDGQWSIIVTVAFTSRRLIGYSCVFCLLHRST